jgi:hypothetical protein
MTSHRLDGRLIVALAAGVAVFLGGARPTGMAVVDLVECVVGVAVVVLVGSRAPWWMLLGAAGLAGSIGLAWQPVVVAAAAFVFAAWISPIDASTRVRADVGAATVALITISFSIGHLDGPTGVSALLGVGSCLALVIGGWKHLEPVARRPLAITVAAVVVGAAAASVAMFIAGLEVREPLRAGTAHAREGARLTADLDAEAAGDEMASAAEEFGEAHGLLDAWWTQPARLVPIVAQHRSAGVELASELADQLDAAAGDLSAIDLERLRVDGGAIDLEAIRDLAAPVGRFADRFDRLEEVAAEADSAWLVDRVRDKLDELDDELLALAPQVDDAVTAVELLPDMLGGDGTRSYLLLLTTPSEARSLGGFIGNYALVTVDDGRMQFVRAGRRSELEAAAEAAEVRVSLPAGLADVVGDFGLGGSEGEPVGSRSWSNLTIIADWPSFAPAALELYNESGFEPVDGVVVVDPYVLGQLSRYSGPVETRDGDLLQGDALVSYLLLGQYDSDDRIDALDVLAERIITAFLDSTLPPPIQLARDFGWLIDEQRLLVWTDRPAEAELIESVGVGAGLPDPSAADAFALGLNNAAGNKLDAFLQTTIEVEHVEGPEGPIVRATIHLHNAAPTEGYPDYVIGNLLDLPTGTHRVILHAYASGPIDDSTLNGEQIPINVVRHRDWHVGELIVNLEPGATTSIVFDFDARHPDDDILVRHQPMVRRD